jgi:hypothetical protein
MSAGFFYTGTTDIDTKYNKANKSSNSTTNFFYKKADGNYADIGTVYTLLSDYPASDWNRTKGGDCNFLSGTTDIGGTFIEGGVTRNEPYGTGTFTKTSIPLIMDIVIRSCDALMKRVKPNVIYRVTKVLFPIQKYFEK